MEFLKILIIEDEKIVALDLKNRLSRLGYDVIGMKASAEEVLSSLKQQLPDIILMDIHIQGQLDGIDLAQQIHQLYSIPIIYITAYSEGKTLERAKQTRPYGYLLKPFSERELDISIQVAVERFHADEKLRKNENHLNLALEAAHLGTWEFDCNASDFSIEKPMLGNFPQDMSWQNLKQMILPEFREEVTKKLNNLKHNIDCHEEAEFQIATDDNTHRWLKLYGKSYLDKTSGSARIVGVIRDISERHDVETQLKQAAAVFKCTAEGIIILNCNQIVESTNQAFTTITNFHFDSMQGKHLPFLTADLLGKEKYQEMWQTVYKEGKWQGEIQAFRENNTTLHLLVNIGVVPKSKSSDVKYVVVISDISALKEVQERLSKFAFYDSLTSLPNRTLLLDRFQQAIIKAERDESLIGVLFVDLDHFKRINDSFGHQVGDNMLRSIAQRLTSRLRKSDTIGRIGGDEFVIIMENLESIEAIQSVARDLLEVIAKPLQLANTLVLPSGSIGISVYPNDSSDREVLIQMADTAMYSAKTQGRNSYSFYTQEMTQQTFRYLIRERELHTALKRQEFVLYYQPICDLSSGKITSLEALIRWHHPTQGLIGAMEIIPFAETGLLIVEIGRWAITEACRELKRMASAGLPETVIAVNVSVKQFTNDDLPQLISKLLYEYRIPPKLLRIEITESCLQQDEKVISSLRKLNDMGIEISLDDFGTGYSCLSSLKNLPIKYLKIDRSFIQDIPLDSNDCAIASAIVAMGHQLNISVVAEGIENKEQLAFLRNLHCDYAQGYFISKPVAVEDIYHFIKQTNLQSAFSQNSVG